MVKRAPITTIVEGQLHLGDRHAAADLGLLRSLGVTHIVNCAKEQPNFHPSEFHYYNCHLRDNRWAQIDFEGPLTFIEGALAQGGVVFVHCMLGKSRSASIVVAYLMRAYGFTLEEAFAKVQELRPCAKPNKGFCRQLQDLEEVSFTHSDEQPVDPYSPYSPHTPAEYLPHPTPQVWYAQAEIPQQMRDDNPGCTVS
jgi:hypothetical protein